jgi:uncharacterized repeat protein (TIGR02543 family)
MGNAQKNTFFHPLFIKRCLLILASAACMAAFCGCGGETAGDAGNFSAPTPSGPDTPTPQLYTVSFDANGGGVVAAQIVAEGKTAELQVPSKTGFDFAGWFRDVGLTDEYDFAAPVFASLTLYAKWDASPIVEAEAELVELSYWFFTSGVMPCSIKMIYPDENAVFNCAVDNGHFRSNGPYVPTKNMDVRSGAAINWANFEYGIGSSVSHAFVEIVIRLEEHIIGYAVIEAYQRAGADYRGDLLKSVLFPQVGGGYQNVSEEYVKTAIEKIKSVNRDAAKVAAAKEELTIAARLDGNIYLPGFLYCEISWASSNEAAINSGTGAVTGQLYDTEVTLTATLALGGATATKEFTVNVVAQPFKEEKAELVEFLSVFGPGFIPPHSIKMKHPDENVIYYYNERFRLWGGSEIAERNMAARSGDIIYWEHFIEAEGQRINIQRANLSIVLKLGDTIIGYAVIHTNGGRAGSTTYTSQVIKSVLFPQVNGEYQNVSEEYVNAAIARAYENYGHDPL